MTLTARLRYLFCAAPFLLASYGNALALDVPLTEFKLGNGMQVVVIPDHRAPVVTHSVWYRVGSADEQPGKSGLAHFLEHLMFKGTKKHPEGEFDHLLEINGAEGNAFTTQDYTAYYQRIASDRLPLVMDLESDRMQNLVLNEDSVKSELKVVQEERRQRTENNPAALFQEKIEAKMFTVHPYGRPVVGWMPEVEKLNLADAMDFYRAHYTPGNATLIIAGDVDPETAKTLAEKYYGPLANTASTAPRRRAAEPNAMEARRLSETSPQAQFSYVTRSYITPSRAQAGPKDSAALDFLAAVLGTGSQSRLYKKLVLEEKLATDVGAGFIGNQLDSGKLTFYCIPAPGVGMDKLENALDTILDDVAKNGVTQTELDRVRNQAIDAQIYALDDPMTLLQHVGTSVMTGLTPSEAFSTSAWNDVAISDVQRELKLIATPANATTGILTKG